MANFFESGFTVLQELAKLKQKEKKDKILAEAKKAKKKATKKQLPFQSTIHYSMMVTLTA